MGRYRTSLCSSPFSIVCHVSPRFGPPGTKIPGDIGPGDHLLQNCVLDKTVRIGDNGPVHILSWFSGSKSRDAL